MYQDRLSHLALLCIERAYANNLDIDEVVDVFALSKKRSHTFSDSKLKNQTDLSLYS